MTLDNGHPHRPRRQPTLPERAGTIVALIVAVALALALAAVILAAAYRTVVWLAP